MREPAAAGYVFDSSHGNLIAYDPCIMALGQERHVAGFAIELATIFHDYSYGAGDVELEMGRFTAFSFGDSPGFAKRP